MPAATRTIVAPLPNDPRVMTLAKSLGLSRREAFACCCEAWAWLSVMAVDGIVGNAVPDTLDGIVDVVGFGQAMLEARLVGVADDGLVVVQREGGVGRGGADDADDGHDDRRRRDQNAEAARRYRRRQKVMRPADKPAGGMTWRSLGHVAGHEVRAFAGPHGCYVMVVGATKNGEPCRKFTAGDKSWSLESVRLVDALPALVKKWELLSRRAKLGEDMPVAVPSYADFRDGAERMMALAKIQADAARHDDGDDASSRHDDASSSSSRPSSDQNAESERKPLQGNGIDASSASSNRHDDGLSSMSYLSKSSSKEEEDMRKQGREAGAEPEPAAMAEWDRKRQHQRMLAERFAAALGEDIDTIVRRWKDNSVFLRLQLQTAGIDPNTGLPVDARAPSKPAGGQSDGKMTTEPMEDDKPVAGILVAPAADDHDRDHDDVVTIGQAARAATSVATLANALG